MVNIPHRGPSEDIMRIEPEAQKATQLDLAADWRPQNKIPSIKPHKHLL